MKTHTSMSLQTHFFPLQSRFYMGVHFINLIARQMFAKGISHSWDFFQLDFRRWYTIVNTRFLANLKRSLNVSYCNQSLSTAQPPCERHLPLNPWSKFECFP